MATKTKPAPREHDKLPLEPLWVLAHGRSDLPALATADGTEWRLTFNTRLFAEMVGVHERTVNRWKNDGMRIPWDTADLAACRLGMHPCEVWGSDWWALAGGDEDFAPLDDVDLALAPTAS